ncbi:MAG: hypothetical protein LGR52_04220 [Candidatus Thiosymbion ectosymbiont of Robbea hypermnestra]|nr:hypothetical protein [Candidatus Thiosymbion ectosymbiont of Robbea hypermnestra]
MSRKKKLSISDIALPKEDVEVTVEISWVPSGDPVEGARVFDHLPNLLLGRTGKDGKFTTKVANGTVLRLVEPKYGLQQALRVVQGELHAQNDIRIARVGEGWTL